MTETTREQDNVAMDTALAWGTSTVLPLDNTDSVIVIGLTDDIERCHLLVTADGFFRQATRTELARAEQRARSAS